MHTAPGAYFLYKYGAYFLYASGAFCYMPLEHWAFKYVPRTYFDSRLFMLL